MGAAVVLPLVGSRAQAVGANVSQKGVWIGGDQEVAKSPLYEVFGLLDRFGVPEDGRGGMGLDAGTSWEDSWDMMVECQEEDRCDGTFEGGGSPWG